MIYTNEYYTATSSVYLPEFLTSVETCRHVTSDFASVVSKSERFMYLIDSVYPTKVKTMTSEMFTNQSEAIKGMPQNYEI
jgi:hypothetical protein